MCLASVLSPAARASIHQTVSPSFPASAPPEGPLRSAWRTAVVKRRWSRAPAPSRSQSPRFSEAPQDPAEGRPGRCLSQRESRLGGPKLGEVGTRLDRRAPGRPSKDRLNSKEKLAWRLGKGPATGTQPVAGR